MFTVFTMLSLSSSKIPAVVKRSKYGIVTIFSKNHGCEAINSCRTYANVSEIRGGSVAIVALYAPDVSETMLAAYRKYCPSVQLRPFTVDNYPAYFKDYSNYRFKFPIVASVLPEFDTIMYIDTSIQFQKKKGKLLKLFKSMETKFAPQGIRLLSNATHSNFPVTHPDMYAFFNVTEEQVTKRSSQFQSGVYLLNNSPQGWNIVDKMVQCALEPRCMAPKGAKVKCEYDDLTKNERVVCHRFDQSALNMRLIELYGTNESLYYQPSSIIDVVRMSKCF
uniref:Nucleotide-diphospho-sugar transferase domain-containing protein n=1 Tax=Panagrellus redivivus TaxID=6233 RepID=A0A7E4VLT7_PANRE